MPEQPSFSVWVEIEIEGEFPSEEELNARNDIIDELMERGIGEVEGAGGGMGMMDFSFCVHDEESAQQLITEVIREKLPGVEFGIDSEPLSEEEADPDPADSVGSKSGCAGMVLMLIVGTTFGVAAILL